MFKIRHSKMIGISGVIWLSIGFMLLSMGINFIVESILKENGRLASRPVLDFFATFSGELETAAIILIAMGLLVGFLKGRVILSKTVARTVERTLAMPNPAPLSQIYPRSYYILLGSMILIGFVVKFLPFDVRGFVDVAIGSALINGAMLYFRAAYETYLNEKLSRVTVSKE